MHLPFLISDLALILGVAAVVTFVFKKLKQPVVLGYLAAGFLVSPSISLLPTIAEPKNITIWAEIGVIFLLFGLGLEFSFKKLAKVGGSAAIMTLIKIAIIVTLGFICGKFLGWSSMDSLFLGALLSISSTVIVLKALEELGLKTRKFATLVLGGLIVEDLVAILMLAFLTTLAVSKHVSGIELTWSLLSLGFMLSIWFLTGIFLIPTFLKKWDLDLNEEMLLVISLSLCLFMVVLAVKAGYSPALGAFMMGSILAETHLAEKIEHLVTPVKNLFGAIFFVSVGMLINPTVIVDYAVPILIITLLTVFGKFIGTLIGALAAGQPLNQSVSAGMSLAQIGEFSFIIATLGLTLKVTSPFLYPIAVTVSAITTFTTPYLMKFSDPVVGFLEARLPGSLVQTLGRYSSGADTIRDTGSWRLIFRSYLTTVITNLILCIAIIIIALHVIIPWVDTFPFHPDVRLMINVGLPLCAMAPFMWGLMFKRLHKQAYSHLLLAQRYNRGPLLALETTRFLMALFLIVFFLSNLFSTIFVSAFVFSIIILACLFFYQKIQKFYHRLESHFLTNLHARPVPSSTPGHTTSPAGKSSSASTSAPEPTPKPSTLLLPWDAHFTTFQIEPESSFAGKTLIELTLRERFGVTIAAIERGELTISLPTPDQRLLPFDKILVLGTDDQLEAFEIALENSLSKATDVETDIGLWRMHVLAHSPMVGQTIRQAGIRPKYQGTVVGIERDQTRILNPKSDMVIEKGDLIWILGNKALAEG